MNTLSGTDAPKLDEGLLISWDITFRRWALERQYTLSEFVRWQNLIVLIAVSLLTLLFQWLALCILYILVPSPLRNHTTGTMLIVGLSLLTAAAILSLVCWTVLRVEGYARRQTDAADAASLAEVPVSYRPRGKLISSFLVRVCAEIAGGPWLSLLWCASLLIGSLDISTALWLTCAEPVVPGRPRFVSCQVWAIGGAPASALITPGFFSLAMVLCSQRALPTVLAILAAFWVAIAQYIVFANTGTTTAQHLSYAFLIVQVISYALFFCLLAAVREWTSRRFFRSNRLQQAGAARLQRFAELMSASSQLMFEMKPVYAVRYSVEDPVAPRPAAGDTHGQRVLTAASPASTHVQLPVDFHWRFLSPAAYSLLGNTSEELLDSSVLSSIHPDDVEGYMSSLELALQGPSERPWVTQFRRVRPDGSTVMVESVAYIRMAAGPAAANVPHIAYILGSERDVMAEVAARDSIGREREARLAAVSAAAAAESSTAYAVHELRNPLHGLAAGMEVLALGLAGRLTGQLKHDFSVVQAALASLRRLVDDILDTAKIKRGVITVSKQPVELRPLLEDLVRQYASFATVPLLLRVAQNVPGLVEIDPLRLRQCLSNAITNAAKHTTTGMILVSVSAVAVSSDAEAVRLGLHPTAWAARPGPGPPPQTEDTTHAAEAVEGSMQLSTSQATGQPSYETAHSPQAAGGTSGPSSEQHGQQPQSRLALVFEVADTGHGLGGTPSEELFLDYAQAESARLSAAGGTGLGLAIVRRIATAMRGIVSLHETRGYPLPAAFIGAIIQAGDTSRSSRMPTTPAAAASGRFLVLGPGTTPAAVQPSRGTRLDPAPAPFTPAEAQRPRPAGLLLADQRPSTGSSHASATGPHGQAVAATGALAIASSTPCAVSNASSPAVLGQALTPMPQAAAHWPAGPYVWAPFTDVYMPIGCPVLGLTLPAFAVPQQATVFSLVLPAVALTEPPTAQEAEASLRASAVLASVVTAMPEAPVRRASSKASSSALALSPSLVASPTAIGTARPDTAAAQATAPPTVDLSTWRVLLADDEQMNRSLGARLLKGAGVAQVDTVPDGEAAIAAVTGGMQADTQGAGLAAAAGPTTEAVVMPWGGYHVLLMDQTMPRMTGAQAAERLRALGCPLPMVAVTGTAAEADMLLLLRSGFDAVLLKPFGVADLRRAMLQAAESRPVAAPHGPVGESRPAGGLSAARAAEAEALL